MKVSGVVAVHNEESLLRYSLPTFNQFDELVFVLDRCTDGSEKLIRKHCSVETIVHKDSQTWTHTRAGETFQTGFDVASNDVVFAVGADLMLPPNLKTIVQEKMGDDVGALFFNVTQCSLNGTGERVHSEYLNFIQRFVEPRRNWRGRLAATGVYCFRRSLARLRDCPAEYRDLNLQIRDKGFQTVFVRDAGILHLRPGLGREKQLWHGQVWRMLGRSFRDCAFSSVFNLKPWMLHGYLSGRN